jgi:membrane-bound ClpP family serine protease
MNPLLDPNIAYLSLVIGFLLAILALFSPGTGLLELGALFAIVLAGISIYNLPVNWWALAVLILGIFPFFIAMRRSRRWVYLIISIAAFLVGSIFIFRTETGAPAINPLLASVVSLLSVPLLWWIARKGMEAIRLKPSHNLEKLIGQIGLARTEIGQEGSVYVNGEDWTAHSNVVIPEGSQVRIIGREGLVLLVEAITPAT